MCVCLCVCVRACVRVSVCVPQSRERVDTRTLDVYRQPVVGTGRVTEHVLPNHEQFRGARVDPHTGAALPLGEGTFGRVWAVQDRWTKVPGAAKVVDAWQNGGIFGFLPNARKISRELALCSRFNHPNLCKLLDVIEIPATRHDDFDQIVTVSELLDTDLEQLRPPYA